MMKCDVRLFLGILLFVSGGMWADLQLASAGKTDYVIECRSQEPLVKESAVDLSHILERVTGAKFPLVTEARQGAAIVIGQVAPGDKETLKERERRIRFAGRNIYLYGESKYGTSAAVYSFLRDYVGCRWFNGRGDELIPKVPNLSVQERAYSHQPSFFILEFGSAWPSSVKNPDIQAFLRRSGAFMMPSYVERSEKDGCFYVGPTNHGLSAYFPPGGHKPGSFEKHWMGPHKALADKGYFKEHPDYFSLNERGVRVPDNQICFSNKEVRRILLENIRTVIQSENYSPDRNGVLDLGHNDRSASYGFCNCSNCQALVQKYECNGGPYFDYLVELGKVLKKEYPKLTIRFFAYQKRMSGKPPKKIVFPDNVSVIVAPLVQDFSKPLTAPNNLYFYDELKRWGKITHRLWIWIYPIMYPHNLRVYSLMPGVYRNAENIRLCYDNNVRYLISEMGGSLTHTNCFKDLNVYLMTRLTEDVTLDENAIIEEYCTHCYGAAGKLMVAYLKEADAACKQDKGYFMYHNDPRCLRELHSPRNLVKWQRMFDEMVAMLPQGSRALLNVNRARIDLDAVTMMVYSDIQKSYPEGATAEFAEVLYKRYLANVEADNADIWKRVGNRYGKIWEKRCFIEAGAKMFLASAKGTALPPPAELVQKYGSENVFSVNPCPCQYVPSLWTEDAAFGYAMRVKLSNKSFGFSRYRVEKKEGYLQYLDEYLAFPKQILRPENLKTYQEKGNAFNAFYLGTYALTYDSAVFMSALPSIRTSMFTGHLFDAAHPGQKYDFYLSMKYEKEDQVLVDRLILCKKKE